MAERDRDRKWQRATLGTLSLVYMVFIKITT